MNQGKRSFRYSPRIGIKVMFSYKIGITEIEHDNFVRNSSQPNLLQSSKWAHVKNNWGNERIGFYRNGELVAVASILIKQLPLGFTMFYIPRGPVMDYKNNDLVTFVMKNLKKYGKKRRSIFIKFDPDLTLIEYPIKRAKQERIEKADALVIIQKLQNLGCKWSGKTVFMSETIQPRHQAYVRLHENQTSAFSSETRRRIRIATSRGVSVSRANISELDDFTKVMSLTEDRKGVSLRNRDYFFNMMEVYEQNAYLHLVKVNVSEHLIQYKEQLIQLEKEIAKTNEVEKKKLVKLEQQKKSVEKLLVEAKSLVEKYPSEVTISGSLSISFGKTMEMLYAGMNTDFRKYFPQYALESKIFEDAYSDGLEWGNMGGIEGNLDGGLTDFKSHFNPLVREYIGEFTLPVNFLYHLANYFYNFRKTLRKKHRK